MIPLIRFPTAIPLMIPAAIVRQELLRHVRGPALQVDVYAACVGLGVFLEVEFAAEGFDFGFYLLDVVGGVVAFADDAGSE